MEFELALSKANRLKLARAFQNCPRVDMSIECAVEGQMGKAFVDDAQQPQVYCINVGPFWYFAGEANSPGADAMISAFPAYNLLMPSAPGWVEIAQRQFGQKLKQFPRYSFSGADLNTTHLESLLANSPVHQNIEPLTAETAAALAGVPDSYFEISDFESAQDFAARSFGFAASDHGSVMGVAYGSLVCSRGIEVSIFVEEAYRRRGVATALASSLLIESLRRGLRPNWDAANPESCRLAEKLGYIPTGTYNAYYHVE